ncbi:HaaA family cyclophane-containing RiPP peptide [Streptomyces sp. NPDC018964]|uniref:HaaA family cyclophane-containing RiPP peptide n=1 Tax=Streptomyces sp. NPDC018964 TaxID=3365058 RepID=UPI0037AABFCE
MPPASAPHAATSPDGDPSQGSAVLARVESRVRQRLETERAAAAARTADSGHAASLTRPWPAASTPA